MNTSALAQQMYAHLQPLLDAAILQIEDESHLHGKVDSHFKVVAVAPLFEGMRLVARHRWMYQALESWLAGGVHALALHLYAPAEWTESLAQSLQSPKCRGGER